VHVNRDQQGIRRVSEISVLVRDAASGLVRVERAVEFTVAGRILRGPGSTQLEGLLHRC
jgi:pilus assembly protein CpaF